MSPGQRKQRARKRRAKGKTRAARRSPDPPAWTPPAHPSPGTPIQGTRGTALGAGYVHVGDVPDFGIPGYDLRSAHPMLVAALLGGEIRPLFKIADVLAHVVLEPPPAPDGPSPTFLTIGARQVPIPTPATVSAGVPKRHAWIVLFLVAEDPAVSSLYGLIMAEESASGGFKRRETVSPLPFEPVVVQPGETVFATAIPQREYKPHRLHFRSDIVPYFVVDNIQINNHSQFAMAGYDPADMFSTGTIDAFVQFEIAKPMMQIRVTVRNIDHQPHPIVMTMIGATLEPARVELVMRTSVAEAIAGAPEAARADLSAQLGC